MRCDASDGHPGTLCVQSEPGGNPRCGGGGGFNYSHSSDFGDRDEVCIAVRNQVPDGDRERRCMSRVAFDNAKRNEV